MGTLELNAVSSTGCYVLENPISPKKSFKKKYRRYKKKGIVKNRSFPIYSTLGTFSGVLALLLLGLGIFLQIPFYIAIIVAFIAAAAILLGIKALKKGESKSFAFIAIMLGAVGALGAIFYFISVL